MLALAIWGVMTLVGYFGGARILLAASNARRIEKQDHPTLWNVVEEMCIASGLSKMPEVYIIEGALSDRQVRDLFLHNVYAPNPLP